jgi:lipopolysaccharide transport protein LptA
MAITFDTRPSRGTKPAGGVTARVADRTRAFTVARRHSHLVRALRVLLPLTAVGLLAAYALVLTVSWQLSTGRIRVGDIQISADDLKMKDPAYFGVTKEGGHYHVRAKGAVVSLDQSEPVKLIDISGELTEASKVVTKLKAKHGLFDNAKGQLELFDGIEIDSSNGTVARLARATLFQKENKVVSNETVTASTPAGSVQASAIRIDTKKRLIAFQGAVSVRLLAGTEGSVGLGRDARKPVDIYSEELDIDEAQKTAHFRGKVVATQGDTTLNTPYLFVKYEGKGAAGLTPGSSQPGEAGSRVTYLWARNGVDIKSEGDRRVTSDLADFDVKADTALFAGNVQVTQEKNILIGGKLFVDRKSARSRMESPPDAGMPAGRIAAMFYQASAKGGPPAPSKATADDPSQQGFGSFKSDPNAPIEIEADTLEVLDASKKAVFTGNVWAKQGEMLVRTSELTAFYTGQSGLGASNAAKAVPAAQVVRVEARRKVLIVSNDGQSATADWANFDVKANTALLGGGVVVMRGKDMAEGPRLKIDLTTGMYRFELEGDAKGPVFTPPSAKADPLQHRTCPPGKQCMLFYPKDVKDRAQDLLKKAPSVDAR